MSGNDTLALLEYERMKTKSNKTRLIRTAAIIAIAGNAVLAALKIITGIAANSAALIGDGLDSSADVLISTVTLIVARIISKPADVEHPYGHGRAETVATVFLSFIIFFAGAQLIVSSASSFISGGEQLNSSTLAIVVTLISIGGKILLALSQHILGKRAQSTMVKANAKNMASDVLISVGVLAGLIIAALTGSALADTLIALLIGLWVIRTAVGIFLEANLELMDGNTNMEPYRVIVEAVDSVEGASNPHRARIRRVAGFWDIDFDIDVDPECTVKDAHDIAVEVEAQIKQRLEDVYDIMIHIEPWGSCADEEAYGLSEQQMRGEELK